MRIYRLIWKSVWLAIVILGLALSILNLPTTGVITLSYVGFGLGAFSTIFYPNSGTKKSGNDATIRWSRLTSVRAAKGAIILVAVAGVGSSLGGLTWGLIFVAAVTSPWSLSQLLGVSGSPEVRPQQVREERGTAVAGLPVRRSIDQLSDGQLCRVWQSSYLTVLHTTDVREREHLSAFRCAILDELERRYPEAFKAWIDSGARASSNPESFLERYAHGQSPADGEAPG